MKLEVGQYRQKVGTGNVIQIKNITKNNVKIKYMWTNTSNTLNYRYVEYAYSKVLKGYDTPLWKVINS